MNSVRSNNLSLKYQRFTPSGCNDVGIRKFDFVQEVSCFLRKRDKYLSQQKFISPCLIMGLLTLRIFIFFQVFKAQGMFNFVQFTIS